jgi:hypothetical protein
MMLSDRPSVRLTSRASVVSSTSQTTRVAPLAAQAAPLAPLVPLQPHPPLASKAPALAPLPPLPPVQPRLAARQCSLRAKATAQASSSPAFSLPSATCCKYPYRQIFRRNESRRGWIPCLLFKPGPSLIRAIDSSVYLNTRMCSGTGNPTQKL